MKENETEKEYGTEKESSREGEGVNETKVEGSGQSGRGREWRGWGVRKG